MTASGSYSKDSIWIIDTPLGALHTNEAAIYFQHNAVANRKDVGTAWFVVTGAMWACIEAQVLHIPLGHL